MKTLNKYLYKLLLIVMLVINFNQISAQSFGNEWIDYNKTYYRIPVTLLTNTNGGYPSNLFEFGKLRRITLSNLTSWGLASVPASDFQIFRNGKEIPLYTTTNGVLGANDYIEFWGDINDGSFDTDLYKNATDQVNKFESLYQDTSIHFLTVNPGNSNARYTTIVNNPDNSTVEPLKYFINTIQYARTKAFIKGTAYNISNIAIMESGYGNGEGLGVFLNPNPGGGFVNLINGISGSSPNAYTGTEAPEAILNYSINNQSFTNDSFRIKIKNPSHPNLDTILVPYVRINNLKNRTGNTTFSNLWMANPITFEIGNKLVAYAPMGITNLSVTYPRIFDFTVSNQFKFTLPVSSQEVKFDAKITATRLEAGKLPYIYDVTNRKRYEGKLKSVGIYTFLLEPTDVERTLIFIYPNVISGVDQHYATINSNSVSRIKFKDYSLPENQGDYLIISNAYLWTDWSTSIGGLDPATSINYVEEYRKYRSSAAGGGFKAIILNIDSLADQFAYGIRKHPLSIRNFVRYAAANFTVKPKHAFIIGKGVEYHRRTISTISGITNGRTFSAPTAADVQLNLVPAFGRPASDALLFVPNSRTYTPLVAHGRLSVVHQDEIAAYLQKVKEYEALEKTDDVSWKKEALHLIGGSDAAINTFLHTSMNNYKSLWEGPLVAGNVETFVRESDPNTVEKTKRLQDKIGQGVGLLTYFGHSAATSLDFEINNPQDLDNSNGRYPFFLLNGCSASTFFESNISRKTTRLYTLSERFVLANAKGSIGMMASSSYGLTTYLNFYTTYWYSTIRSNNYYGKTIGEINAKTIDSLYNDYLLFSPYVNQVMEQTILNGDPAIKLHVSFKPDLEVRDSNIVITPAADDLSFNTDSVTMSATIINNGIPASKPFRVMAIRTLPDGTKRVVYNTVISSITNKKTINFSFQVLNAGDIGLNTIRVVADTIDCSENTFNCIEETFENNNAGEIKFTIKNSELIPYLPYNYSIVNQAMLPLNLNAIASTVNNGNVDYIMELDTTMNFNSPLKYTQNITKNNGNVDFSLNGYTLTDNTVYYWRTASYTNGVIGKWHHSSFIYLKTSSEGFNQSSYYQHLESQKVKIKLNDQRRFEFDSTKNQLYIDHGIYGTSGFGDSEFSTYLNGGLLSNSISVGNSIVFHVFDTLGFKPWFNQVPGSTNYGGLYNSGGIESYDGRKYLFQFSYLTDASKGDIINFLNTIPKGFYVVARLVVDPDPGQPPIANGGAVTLSYPRNWTTPVINGKNLLQTLQDQGFTTEVQTSRWNTAKTFAFIYKKDEADKFTPILKISNGATDKINYSATFGVIDTVGTIESPKFGPAKQWDNLTIETDINTTNAANAGDYNVSFDLIGIDKNNNETVIKTYNKYFHQESISPFVDAEQYPYLKLKMYNSNHMVPAQLLYWRLNYIPNTEGTIDKDDYFELPLSIETNTPTTYIKNNIDSLVLGVGFKNISPVEFEHDSIFVKTEMFNSLGNLVSSNVEKIKSPVTGAPARPYRFSKSANLLEGAYDVKVNYNYDHLQTEQTYINNTYKHSFIIDATPEGKVDSLQFFYFTKDIEQDKFKDTLLTSFDNIDMKLAFTNMYNRTFNDSINVRFVVKKEGSLTPSVIYNTKIKKLVGKGEHAVANFYHDLYQVEPGWNTIDVFFNVDSTQREETLTNNSFRYRFFKIGGVLPLTNIQLNVYAKETNGIINWHVNNDDDISYYELQHTTGSNQDFNTVYNVKALNINNAAYNYQHDNLPAGIHFYRVKVVHKDGTVSYSGVRQLKIVSAINITANPNPFNGFINITINQPDTKSLSYQLINSSGQVLKQWISSSQNQRINTEIYPPGLYYILVLGQDVNQRIKVEKIK
ncbi:putative type IX secretion system sortase PorU2 [Polluticaenibacter yanchengensis]|uniref:C25 family cysteine peptidase n=1 Tax=Polluticaenibacter yanchengensis TaxID=3014562 RepID=A0ABT4ULD7_9BACT|nr:C25 family cysteine peptidase [Chitinophagaceae bacterium LY-5]